MKYLPFLFITLLLSCEQKAAKQLEDRYDNNPEIPVEANPDGSTEVPESVPLSFQMVRIDRKFDCPDPSCTEVQVRYPSITTEGYARMNQVLTQGINARINNYLRRSLDRDTDGLIDQFFIDYQEFKKAFPESTTPWSLDIRGEVSYNASSFASIRIDENAYTGGAHDNSAVAFINFSRSGKPLNAYGDFFKDVTAIRNLANQAFRRARNLQPSDDLANKGFTFENNRFTLPETFGFSAQGLVLYFSAYDVGSYAQGPTEFAVAWKDLSPYLKEIQ